MSVFFRGLVLKSLFGFIFVGFLGVADSVAQFVVSTTVTEPIGVGFFPVTVIGPIGVGFFFVLVLSDPSTVGLLTVFVLVLCFSGNLSLILELSFLFGGLCSKSLFGLIRLGFFGRFLPCLPSWCLWLFQ